jgi:hypothetical protein
MKVVNKCFYILILKAYREIRFFIYSYEGEIYIIQMCFNIHIILKVVIYPNVLLQSECIRGYL